MASSDKKTSRVRINLTGKKPQPETPDKASRVRINLTGRRK